MKTIALFLALVMCSFVQAQQTKIKWGVGAGLNLADMRYSTTFHVTQPNSVVGVNSYVFADILLSYHFSLETELGYLGMGNYIDNIKNGGSFPNEKTRINYIALSILPKWHVAKSGLSIFIGPSLAYKLSSKITTEGSYNVPTGGYGEYFGDDYKSMDIFGVVGADYFWPVGIGLTARYMQGLTSIAGSTYQQTTAHNMAFVFSIAYTFK